MSSDMYTPDLGGGDEQAGRAYVLLLLVVMCAMVYINGEHGGGRWALRGALSSGVTMSKEEPEYLNRGQRVWALFLVAAGISSMRSGVHDGVFGQIGDLRVRRTTLINGTTLDQLREDVSRECQGRAAAELFLGVLALFGNAAPSIRAIFAVSAVHSFLTILFYSGATWIPMDCRTTERFTHLKDEIEKAEERNDGHWKWPLSYLVLSAGVGEGTRTSYIRACQVEPETEVSVVIPFYAEPGLAKAILWCGIFSFPARFLLPSKTSVYLAMAGYCAGLCFTAQVGPLAGMTMLQSTALYFLASFYAELPLAARAEPTRTLSNLASCCLGGIVIGKSWL